MALSLEATKHLIRLQATADALVQSARSAKGGSLQPLRAVGRQLEALAESIRDVLKAEDPDLARQFDQEVGGEVATPHAADAAASAIAGWLRGVVAAEQVEAQLAANAKAYAEEKVRAERGVGFRAPEE